jgi:rhamnogalacturonyl hydrolase YesR
MPEQHCGLEDYYAHIIIRNRNYAYICKKYLLQMKRTILLLSAFCLLINAFAKTDRKKYFNPEYIKSIMEKTTDWQLKNPKHEQNDWTNGAFYAGVLAAWNTTGSQSIYSALLAMGNDSTRWLPGRRWYHADDVAICQTYIDLYRIEKKQEMIQPTIDTLKLFMSKPYPVRGIEVVKWWWCDALFMGPPTMVKMGVTLNDPEYLKQSDIYFKECYDLLYNKKERLFARDLNYVIKNDGKDRYEANGKLIFWSRGNGWVLGGLARLLSELPTDYPERPFYVQLYKEMAARILSLQQSDGLWRASLLDPKSYPGGEVSGSGFFCYALAWGINNGLLNKKTYRPAVEKAWVALNQCVNEEGRVGWVQPIGADPRKNFSAESWEVYGTGAFLLAGSEVIKLRAK